MLHIQISIIATRLDCPYRIRKREMKLVNFKTIVRVCVLLNSKRYAEGCVPLRKERMHVTKDILEDAFPRRRDAAVFL